MNVKNVTRTGLKQCAFALALVSMSLPAHALVQNITAVFRPDPSNPMVNKFENTTPHSGVCAWHVPARCEALNTFSIRDAAFRAESVEPIEANHEDPRKGAYFKVPSSWRDVQAVSYTHLTLPTKRIV